MGKNKIILLLLCFSVFYGCFDDTSSSNNAADLALLPADSGGTQTAYALTATSAPYGFFLYKPGNYKDQGPAYPLLVFLHGSGEKGDSSSDITVLDRVLKHGPPKLIKAAEWNPKYPMLVVSPQCHDGGWNAAKIHDLITYMIENYNVNNSRIYLTGLSMGGYGTFNYCTSKGADSYVAAVVPICGAGNTGKASSMKHIPAWVFHGESDSTVDPQNSIDMVNAINNANPAVRAKLTLYPGVGHDSWTRTYDGSGMGTENSKYDRFDQSIYDWMFKYKK